MGNKARANPSEDIDFDKLSPSASSAVHTFEWNSLQQPSMLQNVMGNTKMKLEKVTPSDKSCVCGLPVVAGHDLCEKCQGTNII